MTRIWRLMMPTLFWEEPAMTKRSMGFRDALCQ